MWPNISSVLYDWATDNTRETLYLWIVEGYVSLYCSRNNNYNNTFKLSSLRWRSLSILWSCPRVREGWNGKSVQWPPLWVTVSVRFAEKGAEPKGKALDLLVDLCSYPHRWSWTRSWMQAAKKSFNFHLYLNEIPSFQGNIILILDIDRLLDSLSSPTSSSSSSSFMSLSHSECSSLQTGSKTVCGSQQQDASSATEMQTRACSLCLTWPDILRNLGISLRDVGFNQSHLDVTRTCWLWVWVEDMTSDLAGHFRHELQV